MSYFGRPFHHPRGHHPADCEVFGTSSSASHVRAQPAYAAYRNSHLVATRSRPSLRSPCAIGGPNHLSAHDLPYLPSLSAGVVSPLAPRFRIPTNYGSYSQVPAPVPRGLISRGISRGAPAALVPSTPLVAFESDARGQEEATPGSPSPDCVLSTPLSSRCKPTNYKVEICRNFSLTGDCPFGARCTYAHGEEELMPRTLIDLDKLQLVDKETYRCHPCLDHIATGYCPRGSLCTCLHDPRVDGAKESWVLRHCDSLAPDQAAEEVSKMHQAQLTALWSVTPVYGFAPAVDWKVGDSSSRADFFEFYGYCCNMSGNAHQMASWPVSQRSKAVVTEVQRLSIALDMRKARKAQNFAFQPTHLLCGEPVLVLQTRYFLLVGSHEVVSIWNEFETAGCNNAVICAREIAFGPVGDASVRPTSIWFNIFDDDIFSCCTKKTSKCLQGLWVSKRRCHSFARQEVNEDLERKFDNFRSIPPFVSHQPADEAAFDLVTEIQSHRHDELLYLFRATSSRAEDVTSLGRRAQLLHQKFLSQQRHWINWQWPPKNKRIGKETTAPLVNHAYQVTTHNHRGAEHNHSCFLAPLWTSFVSNLESDKPSQRSPATPVGQQMLTKATSTSVPRLYKQPDFYTSEAEGYCTLAQPSIWSSSRLELFFQEWEVLKKRGQET